MVLIIHCKLLPMKCRVLPTYLIRNVWRQAREFANTSLGIFWREIVKGTKPVLKFRYNYVIFCRYFGFNLNNQKFQESKRQNTVADKDSQIFWDFWEN